jgi:AraC family transcriptional regulator, regulatory protein of adaptative response / methylated-DNA-[protein]-cysteine methyltransferase
MVPLSAVMPAPRFDDERAWAAVLAREGGYDGRFVYAVATTGVYCRPSCPSRRPARANVSFYRDPESAESAGYRACLRCRPRASASSSALAVAKVRAYIDAHADEPLTLAVLAREAGLSPHHLQRVFKRATGLSPKEYAGALRTQRFKAHVKKETSVTTAIYEAGYGSGSRVYESADARLGMTPATYRQGGRGMHIRYTIADSPLGRLLVCATERGVCAVQLGDSDRALARALDEEYPRAEVERDDATLGPWVGAILAHLQGRSPALDLPLDLQATAFQWSVWKALREIPYGGTRSYAEIAVAVGKPRAVRAVARACAANRVALVVPCHRVIGSDGRAGGYRWGAERKQQLLDQEEARAGKRSGSR